MRMQELLWNNQCKRQCENNVRDNLVVLPYQASEQCGYMCIGSAGVTDCQVVCCYVMLSLSALYLLVQVKLQTELHLMKVNNFM